MEDNVNYPISTLKVDFGCSKGCPADVKSMLKQLKGVKSISIDPDKGRVTVAGNVEPTTLLRLFERMGKKATLYSFDKKPKKKIKHKNSCHCCHDSSSASEEGFDQKMKKKHDQKDRFGNPFDAPQPPRPSYHHRSMFDNNGHVNSFAPPPPVTRYHPMPWNRVPMGYAARPTIYPTSRPPMYGGSYYGHGRPPLWPNRGHYGSRFPRYNSMIHYNNYADNYHHIL